jgi:hypothetical protein
LQPTVTMSESMNVTTADTNSSNASLMGIFAGAQRPVADASEPWVVLPSIPRTKPAGSVSIDNHSIAESHHPMSTATIGRSAHRRNTNRLSRNVDAVIDIVDKQPQEGEELGEERDDVPPLLQRTLRRRGLSDSSIHSTFSSHGTDQQGAEMSLPPSPPRHVPSRMPAWRQPNSVFQTFSQWGMFNFRQPTHDAVASQTTPAVNKDVAEPGSPSSRSSIRGARRDHAASSSVDERSKSLSTSDRRTSSEHSSSSQAATTTDKGTQSRPIRGSHPSLDGGVLPRLASWVTSSIMIDPVSGSDPFIASSLRDELYVHRASVARRIGRKDDTPIGDFY